MLPSEAMIQPASTSSVVAERVKLRRRRIGLAVTVTLICLALSELVLSRMLGNLDVAPFVLEPGDGRCVALEPNGKSSYTGMLLRIPAVVHTVNEHGYRGAARPELLDPTRLRVVALGDSFTFGQGVADDEALPAVLEAELHGSSSTTQQVEVLNFGVPGLNLRESIDQYRYFARRWHARVVVMFLFENDLDRSLCEIVNRRAFMWLTRHSRVFRLAVATLAPQTLGSPSPHSTPARVDALREQLAELDAAVADEGAQLLLVSLADPLADPQTTRRLADELGIPALVLERESFEAYEKIPNETHWTAAGNRLAAAEIAAWMQGKLQD
jgi:lysophospholipase L1-like esterase